MELIKNTVKVGNSAGVLLPRKYLNSQVKVILTPLNIEKDILDILLDEGLLLETTGIYLVGGYARNEQTIDSDIDVLVLTNRVDKRIRKKKYDILLLSRENLEKKLVKNALPLLPMIMEAKPILNNDLLERYRAVKLNRNNSKWHIETTKSAMDLIESVIRLDKEMGKSEVGDALAYSLVLRLRGIYIMSCLKKNKFWSNKEFIDLIRKITNSRTAYDRYSYRKRNSGKIKEVLSINDAENLLNYIRRENLEQEKW